MSWECLAGAYEQSMSCWWLWAVSGWTWNGARDGWIVFHFDPAKFGTNSVRCASISGEIWTKIVGFASNMKIFSKSVVSFRLCPSTSLTLLVQTTIIFTSFCQRVSSLEGCLSYSCACSYLVQLKHQIQTVQTSCNSFCKSNTESLITIMNRAPGKKFKFN